MIRLESKIKYSTVTFIIILKHMSASLLERLHRDLYVYQTGLKALKDSKWWLYESNSLQITPK